MLNIIKNTINRVFASGVDSDASAFITATGLSGTTQKSAITTLVKDLKSSGLWSKMKAVYPMVTDNYNLLSYTEDFSNAYWNKTGTTISVNTTPDPNGNNTAETLIENTTPNEHYTNATLTKSASSITYTASVYFKNASGTRNFGIGITNGLTAGIGAIFSTSGTVVSNSFTIGGGAGFSVLSTSVQSAGNGWYRAIFTVTTDTATRVDFVSYIVNGTSTVFTGNGTSGIYIWGAQLELGTSASIYQPVLGSQQATIASQMKYNLKDPRDLDAAFRLTWSGGWTYSATGATPNGTNAYADTKLNLSTNLSGYNNSFSVYFRQDLYGTYKIGAFGSSFDQGMSAHLGWTNSSGTLYHDNLGRNTITNSTYGTFDAYHISSVTSTSSQKLYRNGVMKLSGAATSGITQPSINFYFGGANANGTASYFDPKQIAFGTLSTSLTDQDAQLLNQIVEKYQVALSRGVQAAQSFYYNSAYSNEANTYLYSTQITGTTQVSAINTLINGLKANNLWTKMKAVYPFVTDKTLQADMAAQMKFNLVNPQDTDAAFRLAFSGGWTYSTNGAQPNGTNGYADTKLVPNTDLTFNNSSFSVYSRTAFTPLTNQSWGVTSSGSFLPIIGATIDTTTRINGFSYSYTSPDALNSATGLNFAAMFLISRTSAASAKLFRNIIQLASTSSQGQVSQPTTTFTFGALRNLASFQDYNNFQYGFAHISNGLSDAEIIIFYQLVQQFQTDLSRQV